jgi:hypothetical protein
VGGKVVEINGMRDPVREGAAIALIDIPQGER